MTSEENQSVHELSREINQLSKDVRDNTHSIQTLYSQTEEIKAELDARVDIIEEHQAGMMNLHRVLKDFEAASRVAK